MIVFYIAGVVLSVVLNLMVVVVVMKKDKMANHLDLFKLSLAISDIIQASIGYPLEIYALLNTTEISKSSCKIAGFSTTFLGLVSISHLLGISVERCVLVNFPWKAREWFSNRWISLYIIIPSWIYGLLWSVMPLLGWSSYEREHGAKYRCSIDLTNPKLNARSYAYSILVACFFIPVIGITVSSLFTLRKMKEMTSQAPVLGIDEIEANLREKREIKHTIMVFVLIATFLIAWAPYASCVIVMTAQGKVGDTLLTYSALFAKTSTLYNPIIYTIFMRDFRYRCLRLLKCINVQAEATTTVVTSEKTFHNLKSNSFSLAGNHEFKRPENNEFISPENNVFIPAENNSEFSTSENNECAPENNGYSPPENNEYSLSEDTDTEEDARETCL